MPKPDFKQQLKNILSEVDVVDLDSYKVGGRVKPVVNQSVWHDYHGPLAEFGSNEVSARSKRLQQLRESLTGTLYSHFYCKTPLSHDFSRLHDVKEADSFIQNLSQSNHSTRQPDRNWRIYHLDQSGNAYAEKNGKLRPVIANTFQPSQYCLPQAGAANGDAGVGARVGLQVNQRIDFFRQGESTNAQPAFYYIHSDEYMETSSPQVRFYWHLKPEGAARLVDKISSSFNNYKVPFNFKCLNHPELYNRYDSAVLYLEKRHAGFAMELINSFYDSIADQLNEGCPSFTLPLKKGLAFADDPGNGQSFGMHRCQILSQALIDIYQEQAAAKAPLSANQKFAIAEATLKDNGVELNKIYLNPNSRSDEKLTSGAYNA